MYVEEQQEMREAIFEKRELVSDQFVLPIIETEQIEKETNKTMMNASVIRMID